MLRNLTLLAMASLLLACVAPKPAVNESMMQVDGPLPTDFSGSWQRNYARDDQVGAVLQQAYYQLSRTAQDQRYMQDGGYGGPSQRDADAVLALARLAEQITRPDILTIAQNENEIRIEREDDFAYSCAFYNGIAKGVNSQFGTEICGWDGRNLVSSLVLPEGLQVINRYTMSEDGQQLRVVTTVASSTSKIPFTLRRFYSKFDHPPSRFHCIETLSMKRVCSTSEIEP